MVATRDTLSRASWLPTFNLSPRLVTRRIAALLHGSGRSSPLALMPLHSSPSCILLVDATCPHRTPRGGMGNGISMAVTAERAARHRTARPAH